MVKQSCSWLRRGTLVLCAAALLVGNGSPVLAQEEATPGAQATPATAWDVPSPSECTVEPREGPLFAEGEGQTAPATPLPLPATPAAAFVVPDSDPVTPEIEAAVTATVRETIACRNANQMLRVYALFTEPMIVSMFGGPATVDPEIRALMREADEVGPLPRRQRVAVLQVSDVGHRPDGRIGAIVTTGTADHIFQDYLVFVYDGASERWLIDEVELLATEPTGS